MGPWCHRIVTHILARATSQCGKRNCCSDGDWRLPTRVCFSKQPFLSLVWRACFFYSYWNSLFALETDNSSHIMEIQAILFLILNAHTCTAIFNGKFNYAWRKWAYDFQKRRLFVSFCWCPLTYTNDWNWTTFNHLFTIVTARIKY